METEIGIPNPGERAACCEALGLVGAGVREAEGR